MNLKRTMFMILIYFILVSSVKAGSCSYKELEILNKEASNIKFNYEINEQKLPEGYHFSEIGIEDNNGNDVSSEFIDYYIGKYFILNVNNLPEDFYVVIEDEALIIHNDNKSTYYYNDTNNGNLALKLYNVNGVKNIKFTIYSDNCNEKVLTKYVKLPRYNGLYDMAICEGIQDYKYCQQFIFTSMSDIKLRDKVVEYKKTLETKEEKTPEKSNIKLIIIISCIAIIFITAIILIVRNKRSKNI